MKKEGVVKTYKTFPENSLSYKLQELNTVRNIVDTNLMFLAALPLRLYIYHKIGSAHSVGYIISSLVLSADLGATIMKSIKLSSSRKELKQLKKEVVEYLSFYEGHIVSTEEEKKELVKKI